MARVLRREKTSSQRRLKKKVPDDPAGALCPDSPMCVRLGIEFKKGDPTVKAVAAEGGPGEKPVKIPLNQLDVQAFGAAMEALIATMTAARNGSFDFENCKGDCRCQYRSGWGPWGPFAQTTFYGRFQPAGAPSYRVTGTAMARTRIMVGACFTG